MMKAAIGTIPEAQIDVAGHAGQVHVRDVQHVLQPERGDQRHQGLRRNFTRARSGRPSQPEPVVDRAQGGKGHQHPSGTRTDRPDSERPRIEHRVQQQRDAPPPG